MDSLVIGLLIIGVYPYAIYPLLLWVLFTLTTETRSPKESYKSVAVVIAAFNEEDCIEATVLNKLEQDYPHELIKVVVVSDGSTDSTDEIVGRLSLEDSRVRLIRQKRAGKTAGLNKAVESLDSEIVVFSDANSRFSPEAIRKIVESFDDAIVGYVTGQMLYQSGGNSIAGDGSSTYMKYENQLRIWESRIGSVVGVDGGIDAVRRDMYRPMSPWELPDFALPLAVVEQGGRVVYQPEAIVYEDALESSDDEFRMRVRVASRALWTLVDYWRLLNPIRFGLFSWQLASHKWLRYLSFLPLGFAVLFATYSTSQSVLALTVCALATVFVLAGLAAILGVKAANSRAVPRLAGYFLLINVSSFFGLINVLRGKRITTWEPRVG